MIVAQDRDVWLLSSITILVGDPDAFVDDDVPGNLVFEIHGYVEQFVDRLRETYPRLMINVKP